MVAKINTRMRLFYFSKVPQSLNQRVYWYLFRPWSHVEDQAPKARKFTEQRVSPSLREWSIESLSLTPNLCENFLVNLQNIKGSKVLQEFQLNCIAVCWRCFRDLRNSLANLLHAKHEYCLSYQSQWRQYRELMGVYASKRQTPYMPTILWETVNKFKNDAIFVFNALKKCKITNRMYPYSRKTPRSIDLVQNLGNNHV